MKPLDQWTEQEIDVLQAGRETDALVERDVMGATLHYDVARYGAGAFTLDERGWVEPIPHRSTDISAAYIMEPVIHQMHISHDYASYLYRIILKEFGVRYFPSEHERWYALAHATPLQRCKAALKAVRAMRLRAA